MALDISAGEFCRLDHAVPYELQHGDAVRVLMRPDNSLSRLLAAMLRDLTRRHQTITQIAFQCGCNNATHFGVAFKRRFDLTPREYRARAASAGARPQPARR